MTDATAPTPEQAAAVAPAPSAGRDEVLDLLRGLAMASLLLVHVELLSPVGLLAWERVGFISGAEVFVLISGVVLGWMHQRVHAREGLEASWRKLWARAAQLYRVHLSVICAVGVGLWLRLPGLEVLAQYVDRGSGKVFPLYPSLEAPLWQWVARALSLQAGPHQVQILGLYVVLLFAAPLVLVAFRAGLAWPVLGASWFLYAHNALDPWRVTGCSFEYGFPSLTWQLLFVHGLALGYHREAVAAWWARGGPWKLPLLVGSAAVCLLAFGWAQCTPNPLVPAWARVEGVVPPELFSRLQGAYLYKNTLGLGRLLNLSALLLWAYLLAKAHWPWVQRLVGWWAVPVGQSTLYVFVVHAPMLWALHWAVGFGLEPGRMATNALLHLGVLMGVWFMIRHQVAFRWIPR